jgi:hypothetical protein
MSAGTSTCVPRVNHALGPPRGHVQADHLREPCCWRQQYQSSGDIVLVHPRPFWSHQLQLPHKHVYASSEQHLKRRPALTCRLSCLPWPRPWGQVGAATGLFNVHTTTLTARWCCPAPVITQRRQLLARPCTTAVSAERSPCAQVHALSLWPGPSPHSPSRHVNSHATPSLPQNSWAPTAKHPALARVHMHMCTHSPSCSALGSLL